MYEKTITEKNLPDVVRVFLNVYRKQLLEFAGDDGRVFRVKLTVINKELALEIQEQEKNG